MEIQIWQVLLKGDHERKKHTLVAKTNMTVVEEWIVEEVIKGIK